jgi:hypothetical protein
MFFLGCEIKSRRVAIPINLELQQKHETLLPHKKSKRTKYRFYKHLIITLNLLKLSLNNFLLFYE